MGGFPSLITSCAISYQSVTSKVSHLQLHTTGVSPLDRVPFTLGFESEQEDLILTFNFHKAGYNMTSAATGTPEDVQYPLMWCPWRQLKPSCRTSNLMFTGCTQN